MTQGIEQAIERIEGSATGLSESQFKEILVWSSNLHATIIVDMETQIILRATDGANEMFGYVMDELIGLPLEMLVPDDVRPHHADHVKGYNNAPRKRSMGRSGMNLRGRKRDGTEFRVEISLLPRVFAGHRIAVANLVSLEKEEI